MELLLVGAGAATVPALFVVERVGAALEKALGLSEEPAASELLPGQAPPTKSADEAAPLRAADGAREDAAVVRVESVESSGSSGGEAEKAAEKPKPVSPLATMGKALERPPRYPIKRGGA
eukprot:TRINITY_DN9544_c0_g1_i1.p1 TRINITY_DN9544_c0_g1~~TRINITY_DN9544_c0_g1_i1.p1  ORF type:complete len:120 (+),score=27.77 TRINITY_DN9544_c0_g1_i1:63-422(+)